MLRTRALCTAPLRASVTIILILQRKTVRPGEVEYLAPGYLSHLRFDPDPLAYTCLKSGSLETVPEQILSASD